MPSTINADRGIVSGITGIVQTADNTGNLTLQANGVSVLTVNTSNAVTVTGSVSATGNIQGNYVLGNGSLLTGVAASGGGITWANVQTANLTAVAGNAYPINTTSTAIYVTLPASPGAGNLVQVVDYAKTFATNNCILNPNGSKINANTANVSLINNGMSVTLVYTDATQGWIPVDGFTQPPTAATYSISYLVVAGGAGGGGGTTGGGGGGAGGMLAASTTVTKGTAYNITVGGGGSGTNTNGVAGTSGTNSVLGALATALGGGGGGGGNGAGVAGGSGGGAGRDAAASGGTGTAGQGNNGGATPGNSYAAGAGGGGSGAVGGNGSPSGGGPTDAAPGGNGGGGSSSSITGTATTYAGGGGGSAYLTPGGSGGSGGGGAGGSSVGGTNASANLGGAGGGGRGASGGNGGSGIVVLAIPTANYSGTYTGTPAVSTSGANTILQFTGSGSYTA
jgi:hypothetical protein